MKYSSTYMMNIWCSGGKYISSGVLKERKILFEWLGLNSRCVVETHGLGFGS